MAIAFPPRLSPSSVVAVVAPSGPFDREELLRGLAWLAIRYRLRFASGLLGGRGRGYLAAADGDRAADVAGALLDPTVDAVLCARGGYGAMRITAELPWARVAERPKWVIGFSDVTALHLELAGRGIASVHGPNVTGLGRSITAAERHALIGALEGLAPAPWTDLEVLAPGRARGALFGGNLTLVASMAAAGRLEVPAGAILALEDVGEAPYRVDRMLTSLLLGGHLARAGGIVFGGFTRCAGGPDGVTVEEVLRERTSGLGIPVLAAAPFGHGERNLAFVLGAAVELAGGTLTFQDPDCRRAVHEVDARTTGADPPIYR